MLETGDRVDKYVVEGPLGQGGMAMVYLVRHDQLGTQHALKVLGIQNPLLSERMRTEGRVQASLEHPNVVRVTDIVEVGRAPGLVMEFVDGLPLDHWLVEHPDAPLEVRDALARQIIGAVGHAHEHGLIHRDLKPSNVLLTGDPATPLAKVADFGLAKLLTEASPNETASGVAMGTPRYMAPEQIRDAKRVDARADVFSLGCVLYEIYCQAHAFGGVAIVDIFNDIMQGHYRDPGEFDVPDRAVAAIRGALVVDPAARIADCTTLQRVLDGDEAGPEPVLVLPDDTVVSSRRSGILVGAGVGAGVGMVGVVAVAAVALLAVLGLGWVMLGTPDRDDEVTEQPRPAPRPDPSPVSPSPRPAPPVAKPKPPTPKPRPKPKPKPGGKPKPLPKHP